MVKVAMACLRSSERRSLSNGNTHTRCHTTLQNATRYKLQAVCVAVGRSSSLSRQVYHQTVVC
eukprot:6194094-Pleurochrysis_carterae.AAC.2